MNNPFNVLLFYCSFLERSNSIWINACSTVKYLFERYLWRKCSKSERGFESTCMLRRFSTSPLLRYTLVQYRLASYKLSPSRRTVDRIFCSQKPKFLKLFPGFPHPHPLKQLYLSTFLGHPTPSSLIIRLLVSLSFRSNSSNTYIVNHYAARPLIPRQGLRPVLGRHQIPRWLWSVATTPICPQGSPIPFLYLRRMDKC